MNRLLVQLPVALLLMVIPQLLPAQHAARTDTLSGGSNEEVVAMGSGMRERLIRAPAGGQKALGLYFRR